MEEEDKKIANSEGLVGFLVFQVPWKPYNSGIGRRHLCSSYNFNYLSEHEIHQLCSVNRRQIVNISRSLSTGKCGHLTHRSKLL